MEDFPIDCTVTFVVGEFNEKFKNFREIYVNNTM